MNSKDRRYGWLSGWWPRRGEILLGIAALGVLALAMMTLSPRATRAAMWATGRFSAVDRLDRHLNPFRTRHTLYECGLPVYDLSIAPVEYRKILTLADEAGRRGNLSDDLKQWSRAKFIHNGAARYVKIRIRGDLPNHWKNANKSWRIRFPKDDPLQGVGEFNLILLSDPKSLPQRFTNVVFKRLGMMTLRDGYAVLRINGVLQGIYYQVEHFDDPFLEHNQRPQSSIFKHPRWGREIASFEEQVVPGGDHAWQMLQMLLDYEVLPTPEKLVAASSVTDMDDYLRFVAGTTLFCSDHTNFFGDNHKLYYDPSQGLFYRIPWDVVPNRIPTIYRFDAGERWRGAFDVFRFHPMSEFRRAVISDPAYRLRRDRMLWELVGDNSLLNLFDETYEGLSLALWSNVMGDGTEVGRLAGLRHLVKWNVEYIRRALVHNQLEVRARWERAGLTSLQFAVNNASGVVVQRIRLGGLLPDQTYRLFRDLTGKGEDPADENQVAITTADVNGTVTFDGLSESMLPDTVITTDLPARPKPINTVVYPKTRRFDYLVTCSTNDGKVLNPLDVRVTAVNAVTDRRLTAGEVHTLSYRRDDSFAPTRRTLSRKEFLHRHGQFTAPAPDHGEDVVVLPRGTHRFDETVVVPEGVTLEIAPGAELRLGPDVSLICFGPVRAAGTTDAPIRIGPASNQPWGTFAVVRPGAPSTFRHVHLTGGGGAVVDGILFTGALAVHGGDLNMEHCRITDCQSEDAVNVKHGEVLIRSTYFGRNAADGLDLDFVGGEVSRCHLADHAGDAVDLSGSTISITGNRIERAGDKGISVGEASRAILTDNLIVGGTIGVAVKDRSIVQIEHCTLLANTTSVAVYRKKPIFGGGTATISASVISATRDVITTDPFSTVEVRDCIVSGPVDGDDCTIAASDLFENLRSYGYVLDPDKHPAAGSPGAATANRTGPGILRPPVEFSRSSG